MPPLTFNSTKASCVGGCSGGCCDGFQFYWVTDSILFWSFFRIIMYSNGVISTFQKVYGIRIRLILRKNLRFDI